MAFYLTFYSGILPGIYSNILFGILCGIYTDIFSGILLGIFSAICSGIRSCMLSRILSDILFWHSTSFSGILSGISSVVDVRQGTVWSGARGRGPARNTLIRSLRWRSGWDHSDPQVAVGVRRGTLRSRVLEVAVEVRRGAEEGGRKEKGGRKEEAGRLTHNPTTLTWHVGEKY